MATPYSPVVVWTSPLKPPPCLWTSLFPAVVSQHYITEAENEYVIRGNSAVMKCKIPSFVADFVSIDAWLSDSGDTHMYNTGPTDYGNLTARAVCSVLFSRSLSLSRRSTLIPLAVSLSCSSVTNVPCVF